MNGSVLGALAFRMFRFLVVGFVIAAIGIIMINNAIAELPLIMEAGLFNIPGSNAEMFWWGITLGPILTIIGIGVFLLFTTGKGERVLAALVAGGILTLYGGLTLAANIFALSSMTVEDPYYGEFLGNLVLGGVLLPAGIVPLILGMRRLPELQQYVALKSRDQRWRRSSSD